MVLDYAAYVTVKIKMIPQLNIIDCWIMIQSGMRVISMVMILIILWCMMLMMMLMMVVGCMGAMVKVIRCQEEKINGCVSVRTVQRESRDCDFHQGDHHHDLDEFYPVFERLVIAIIMPLVKITSCLFQLW